MNATTATPARATNAGHGRPALAMYHGRATKAPTATGVLVRVEATATAVVFIDAETGARVDAVGTAGKYWAAPVVETEPTEAEATTADEHGNRVAREGVDRCTCGSKYWEHDRCVDCGVHVSEVTPVSDTMRDHRLPAVFAHDFTASGCHEELPPTETWRIVADSGTTVLVEATDAQIGNLLDRADLYADPGYAADLGPEYRGLVQSARTTLRRYAADRARYRQAYRLAVR